MRFTGEPPESPQLVLLASVNSEQSFHGIGDSELYSQPTIVLQYIDLLNPTWFIKTSSNGPSDRMDSPAQTVMRTARVSHPPGECWVARTTNINTPMPDINNLLMDADEEVLNISRNILDNEEPKCYRQAISGPKADLWHSAIEAEIDALLHNYT
jgi:hypothetical protein